MASQKSYFMYLCHFFTDKYHYEREKTNIFLPVIKDFFYRKKVKYIKIFKNNCQIAKFENDL